jgi:pSer/pThr/pTyr-binding forkhead associated (FHA) protein
MIQKTIGRSSENEIIIKDDLMVSRNHAILYYDEGSILIEDLNSANGSFVNGNRINSIIKLDEYDILKVGNSLVHWNKLFEESDGDESNTEQTDVVENIADAPEIPNSTENPENLKTITENRKSESSSFSKSIPFFIGLIIFGLIIAFLLMNY